MAEQKPVNATPVAKNATDRVAMLSLTKEGVPDQVNPEIIGDKDFARAATRRQFSEQAVSASDDAANVAAARDAATGDEVGQDPTIEARQKEHARVSSAAEKKADAVVDSLSE